jgi:pimeloyl-ACP methyl ester carboxylesterase
MQLNFKKLGEQGDHLIILHGLFGMLDNWQTLAGQFAQHYQVWIVDQRNHGKSPHSQEFNYRILADDLDDFMQQHGIQTAHLIGHSMGGKTVMEFALVYPQKIQKLIVVDIAPKAYFGGSHLRLIDAMRSLDLSKVNRRNDADNMLKERIPEEGVRLFLLKNLMYTDHGYDWKVNLASLDANYKIITGSIDRGNYDGPTLFIRGEQSDYIQLDDMDEIKEMFTNAEFVTIAGVGHWVHAEAPKEFLSIAEDFLRP